MNLTLRLVRERPISDARPLLVGTQNLPAPLRTSLGRGVVAKARVGRTGEAIQTPPCTRFSRRKMGGC